VYKLILIDEAKAALRHEANYSKEPQRARKTVERDDDILIRQEWKQDRWDNDLERQH
jgi:hypothetical protein